MKDQFGRELPPKEEKKLRTAYIQTFGTVAGQAVLKDLQTRCFKYQSTFVPGDPYASHVNIGTQNVLRTIEELMSDEGIKKLDDTSGKE